MADIKKPRKPAKPRKTAKAGAHVKRKPKARVKPKAKQKPSVVKKIWQLVKVPLLKFCALFIFVFACYLGYLDYTVRKQFEGKRWSIPAHVYASPVEIYAGLQMNAQQLLVLLKRLHYRRDAKLSSQATYNKKTGTISLKTRQFVFWDKTQEVQHIRIAFSATEVRSITDMQSGRELTIVRLDPVQIGSFYPAHKEDRVLVKLEEVPETLVQGLLATEDHDFYQHIGISFKGIARAMWVNLRKGKMVQGGSTITQQLVKNFY